MTGENTKVYLAQGGDSLVASSGGTITAESGSTITGAAGSTMEMLGTQRVNSKTIPTTANFTIGTGTTNQVLVTVQGADASGNAVATSSILDLFFSDSAAGLGLTTNSSASAVTASTGAVIGTGTSLKAYRVQTSSVGVVVVTRTDTAKGTGIYVAAGLPSGQVAVSTSSILSTSYG